MEGRNPHILTLANNWLHSIDKTLFELLCFSTFHPPSLSINKLNTIYYPILEKTLCNLTKDTQFANGKAGIRMHAPGFRAPAFTHYVISYKRKCLVEFREFSKPSPCSHSSMPDSISQLLITSFSLDYSFCTFAAISVDCFSLKTCRFL